MEAAKSWGQGCGFKVNCLRHKSPLNRVLISMLTQNYLLSSIIFSSASFIFYTTPRPFLLSPEDLEPWMNFLKL